MVVQKKRTGILGLVVGLFVVISLIYLISKVGGSDTIESTLDITKTVQEEVLPDEAVIIFSIVTLDKEINSAITANSKINNRLIEAFDEEYEVETTRYTVREKQEWNREQEKYEMLGFEVVNTVKVTTDNIDRAGTIIEDGVSLGANRVDRIFFQLSEDLRKTTKNDLLKKAVKEARLDANNIAKLSGTKVKRIIQIRPNDNSFYPVFERSAGLAMDESAKVAPMIAPGEQTVSYSISFQFEIK